MLQMLRKLISQGDPSHPGLDEVTTYNGLTLPPHRFRKCTADYKDDRYFVESAQRDVRTLIEFANLSPDSRVLDIGCGAGRLAVGLLAEFNHLRGYHGLDVDQPAIAWAQRHIQSSRPSFRFDRLDVYNERYNPEGRVHLDDSFALPVDTNWSDVINLNSVFTHMEEADIRVYLRELRRVVHPTGCVFCTAYVEPDVPDVSINPEDYDSAYPTSGPLHRVRFNHDYFQRMIEQSGLQLAHFRHKAEFDGQSGAYLRPAA